MNSLEGRCGAAPVASCALAHAPTATDTTGTMKIRRKLLLTFTLAGGVVAIAGASGIEPLFRIARAARDTQVDVAAVADELRRAFTLTYSAAALIVMLSMLTTLRIAQRLTRLRKDAENVAKGIGDGMKVDGNDEIDLIALAFNELHGTMKTLEARQIKEEE